jgi:hypothetical protein
MSPNPTSFIQHLRSEGYHPRSDKHSNNLALGILTDLVTHCPKIRAKAAAGNLVYDINFTIKAGTADWNVDLVMGAPRLGAKAPAAGELIVKDSPSSVEIAIELKAVFTEHHKAVKNRKRDFEAHHGHVHNYNNNAVAGGVMIVNGASTFQSPLRKDGPTIHKNPSDLVAHCIAEMRAVTERHGLTGSGLEAKCVVVVRHDNINNKTSSYLTKKPAPQVGDPLHYDAFIQSICSTYTTRF